MEYLKGNMDWMAGTVICEQQNNKTNNKFKTGSQQKNANLNITLHTKPANICCCLWLQQQQQPSVIATTNYCCWHKTTCRLDDRILTNYNCNIKSVQQQQKKYHQKRPLTLSIAVIIMSLSILLIQMPTMVNSRAIYNDESLALSSVLETSADYTVEESENVAEISIDESSSSSSSSSSSLDQLSYLDVIKHVQRNEEYNKERRKNLRKRHSNNWIISKYVNDKNGRLEWKNTCNVHRVDMSVGAKSIPKYHYYMDFDALLNMQTNLNSTKHKISLNKMYQWLKPHADRYSFLPKLNDKKHTVNLSRWYRNLQMYVGSIGYLARAQYNYDMKMQHESEISEELNELLESARSILCGLEIAINGSAPKNNEKKLKSLSREAMYSRFDFLTDKLDGSIRPRILDMRFVKHNYINYVEQMKKILKRKLLVMSKKHGFEYIPNDYSNVSNVIVGDVSDSYDYKYKSDEAASDVESFEQHYKKQANH